MARVFFPTSMQGTTGGLETYETDAPSMRGLRRRLEEEFPGIGEQLQSAAVAIDGDIVPGAWLEMLEPDSEVHFLPPLSGG